MEFFLPATPRGDSAGVGKWRVKKTKEKLFYVPYLASCENDYEKYVKNFVFYG